MRVELDQPRVDFDRSWLEIGQVCLELGQAGAMSTRMGPMPANAGMSLAYPGRHLVFGATQNCDTTPTYLNAHLTGDKEVGGWGERLNLGDDGSKDDQCAPTRHHARTHTQRHLSALSMTALEMESDMDTDTDTSRAGTPAGSQPGQRPGRHRELSRIASLSMSAAMRQLRDMGRRVPAKADREVRHVGFVRGFGDPGFEHRSLQVWRLYSYAT